jgi:hypothetical protein
MGCEQHKNENCVGVHDLSEAIKRLQEIQAYARKSTLHIEELLGCTPYLTRQAKKDMAPLVKDAANFYASPMAQKLLEEHKKLHPEQYPRWIKK